MVGQAELVYEGAFETGDFSGWSLVVGASP